MAIGECTGDWRLTVHDSAYLGLVGVCGFCAQLGSVGEKGAVNAAGALLAPDRGMKEETEALRRRTHAFLVRTMAMGDGLDSRPSAQGIAAQLVDAAGGTDSNYRAACRARSKKEFIAKLGIAIEEVDECEGWLKALRAGSLADRVELDSLLKEADELTRIFVKSRKTAETNLARAEREIRRKRKGR